ncbi:unnamed protein product [Leptidea sinapis]|uniref:glutathione transferase n=1 Tax=Leptidea sinapis TaxID=189913 RepID=A0A5E4PUS4_9NEOP|nr:unnamed protein product [Leptidea sinapis]
MPKIVFHYFPVKALVDLGRLCLRRNVRLLEDDAADARPGDQVPQFQAAEELVRLKWIDVVRKQRSEYDWMPTENTKICSEHFDSEQKYTSAKGRTLLKKSAVPIFKRPEHIPLRENLSPDSLDDVDISDMESIFDTPRKCALKKKVHRLVCEKENLQKRNKILKQQNGRLKKKMASTKTILKTLKNRRMENVTVYYFPVKAMGESIRMLLAYGGQEFEDKRIGKDDWPAYKESMPFGQMPVLEINGKKYAQTVAIARLLGRKYGLVGDDIEQDFEIDQNLTWGDFVIAGMYDCFKMILKMPDLDEKYQNIKRIKNTVLSIPKVKEFCDAAPKCDW